MKKKVIAGAFAGAIVFGTAGPAAAHNLEIVHPHTGETVNELWVGGFTVPEPAQDAPPMFGPFRLPPSHNVGLPSACSATAGNGVVNFLAPPFGSCVHGGP